MKPESVTEAAYKRTMHLNVPVDHAFRVFTQKMGAWWPATHHVGATPFKDVLIDPKKGGRWYEINANGEECIWGSVVAWEPPKRVVLSWHLQPDWTFSPDMTKASEVALEFIPEGPEKTRLEFEHRHLERHGEGWQKMREQVASDGGWPVILDLYLQTARPEVKA